MDLYKKCAFVFVLILMLFVDSSYAKPGHILDGKTEVEAKEETGTGKFFKNLFSKSKPIIEQDVKQVEKQAHISHPSDYDSPQHDYNAQPRNSMPAQPAEIRKEIIAPIKSPKLKGVDPGQNILPPHVFEELLHSAKGRILEGIRYNTILKLSILGSLVMLSIVTVVLFVFLYRKQRKMADVEVAEDEPEKSSVSGDSDEFMDALSYVVE